MDPEAKAAAILKAAQDEAKAADDLPLTEENLDLSARLHVRVSMLRYVMLYAERTPEFYAFFEQYAKSKVFSEFQ